MKENANLNEPSVHSRMVQEVLDTEHALDEALLADTNAVRRRRGAPVGRSAP
jgi:hypothetical protein